MSEGRVRVRFKELKSDLGVLKDFELSIGKIVEDSWAEKMGPTPFPSVTDLREWDFKLLKRYRPFYMPFCDLCCLCIDYDMPLTLGDGSTVQIGRFVEELSGTNRKPENHQVLSFDLDNVSVKRKRVKNIFRHPAPPILLEVSTRGGRRIRLTPNHKILAERGCALEWVRADELEEGDVLIVVGDMCEDGSSIRDCEQLDDRLPKIVGVLLKECRETLRVSMSDLPIDQDEILKWESGDAHPSRHKIERVIKSLEEMMDGYEEKAGIIERLERWLKSPVSIDEVASIRVAGSRNGEVYNLEVEDTHNYIIDGIVAQNCTFGKCDLTGDKRGACGLNMAAQQSRIVLLACCIGASAHIAHARHLINHLIERFGYNHPIDVGGVNVELEAPITRLVCGIRPRTLGDLEDVLNYLEEQLTHLLSSTCTGQEGSNLDLESKVLHAGMIDHLGMEIADIAQIAAYNFPKADPEAPLADIGFGVVDSLKPVILVIGHNVPPAIEIVDYLTDNGLYDKVEVTGLCCTSHDLTRYDPKTKIVGPISWQLRFIRSGVPDVIVIDEQCIRADVLEEAKKVKAPLIATNEKNCLGLPDRTGDDPDDIVRDLINRKIPGALILDPVKVGEVSVKAALSIAPERRKFKAIPDVSDVIEGGRRCRRCGECRRACPNDLDIPSAMVEAADGNLEGLALLYERCIGCARCERACPLNLPLHSFILKAAEKKLKEEKYKIRTGRGAIQDIEIREVGRPIVFGEIPGVIAFVGCANYPNGSVEVAEMAMEFAKRRYIVLTSGCAAMSTAMFKDEEGRSPYEMFSGRFDAGGIINVGSCIANSHIAGAVIKIASIFAKKRLRGNYEEIADYILNRIGAVGVAWGAMSQKAASIASGFWRLGVPVIVGPHGTKYRRMLLGRKDKVDDWLVYDARTGEKVYVGPAPEHLFYAAETKEEAMVMTAKLCMRPNDTAKGRSIKLTHYIDLSKRLLGIMPEDIHLFIRTPADIPITMKDEIMKILKEKGWKEQRIPDPTLLPRMVRRQH